jgi:uncharacterized membrane protein YraQ (UPF0718 family)
MNEVIGIIARELARILEFILGAFAHTWPLWVVSIPLAAAVKMSSLSARLGGLISMRPISAVLFATLVGAVSPLCSCSVIPVIFSLLSAGVPLAPVMSFWLASPSMDPEIFLLSVSTLGWPLAIARLAATTIMSLGGGLIVILLEKRGFFAGGVLREAKGRAAEAGFFCGKGKPRKEESAAAPRFTALKPAAGCAYAAPAALSPASSSCCAPVKPAAAAAAAEGPEGKGRARRDFASRFGKELLASFLFVAKFMAIAFALEALIKFYLPEAWVKAALGAQNAFAVPIAVLVGIPFYTTNAQALGMIGGLLGKGMSQAAALSFLIGGATTTLPAMSAVYGIAKPRVFAVYLGSAVLFSLATGLLWSILPF